MDKEYTLKAVEALWHRVNNSSNAKFNRKMLMKAVDEEFVKMWSAFEAKSSSI